jgi:mono/diheme cytochrome c family protein
MRRRLLLAFVVFAALVGAFALAGCGGGDDDGDEAAPAATETETEAADTEGGDEAEATGEGDAEAGALVFEEAGCGSCHTLEAAGSTGTVGPNLDELQPSLDSVVEQVTNGGGGMPAFGDQLTEQQISDVAAYVVESTEG